MKEEVIQNLLEEFPEGEKDISNVFKKIEKERLRRMIIEDKRKMFSVFDAGWDIETVDKNKKDLLALGEGVEAPPGTTSSKPYSVFMAIYAAFCRYHMKTFGTTQRQIADVVNFVIEVRQTRAADAMR